MASLDANPIVAEPETGRTNRLLTPRRVERDQAMTKALRENRGVISLARLQQLEFSEDEVRGFVAHGDLRRLYRGVYGDGRNRLTDDAQLAAALLAVGNGAWLAGKSAAAVWGFGAISLARIEINVATSFVPRHRGLRIRRVVEQPHPAEIRSRRGLRVSSVATMLIEVARTASSDELTRLIEAAARVELLDLDEVEGAMRRHRGRAGVGKLKRALVAYRPAPKRKSGFERAFDRWLLTHPDIPEPERNVRFAGKWELDCYWPQYGLVLELDGRSYHIAARDFERDRIKDACLQREGLRVLRVSGERWRDDRTGVHSDLIALLALGGYQPERRSGRPKPN